MSSKRKLNIWKIILVVSIGLNILFYAAGQQLQREVTDQQVEINELENKMYVYEDVISKYEHELGVK